MRGYAVNRDRAAAARIPEMHLSRRKSHVNIHVGLQKCSIAAGQTGSLRVSSRYVW